MAYEVFFLKSSLFLYSFYPRDIFLKYEILRLLPYLFVLGEKYTDDASGGAEAES